MAEARGEKIVRSLPRSRCSLSCAFSRLARICSSLMRGGSIAAAAGFLSAASCASRNSCSSPGAVV
jgi:hypothetical protein